VTGTELATTSSGTLALRGDQIDWTPAQRAALDQIGIADAPPGDQQVFLHVAQRVGLDPFARQIYLIARNDRDSPTGKKWTIQTGIDGFRLFCERDKRYDGEGDPAAEWCGPDGVWKEMWADDDNPPVAARFTVKRKDHTYPVRAIAHYREYVQTKYDGEPTKMWKTKAAGQLAKCAEALARRRLFPQDLSNIYTDDEMEHLNNPQPTIIESERERPAEPDWDALIKDAEGRNDRPELKKIWDLARGLRPNDVPLLDRIASAGARVKAATEKASAEQVKVNACVVDESGGAEPAAPEKSQTNRLFALLRDGGVNGSDREVRLRIAGRILNRPPAEPVTSFDQLTASDVDTINDFLQRCKDGGTLTHTLADLASTEGNK
jgi:phage recombination protein Bet